MLTKNGYPEVSDHSLVARSQGVFFDPKWSQVVVRVLRPCNILRSYQDGYRLVTMCIPGDFIVVPHWEIMLLAPYPDIELTSPCPILLMLSARLGSDKYQFYKLLV